MAVTTLERLARAAKSSFKAVKSLRTKTTLNAPKEQERYIKDENVRWVYGDMAGLNIPDSNNNFGHTRKQMLIFLNVMLT